MSLIAYQIVRALVLAAALVTALAWLAGCGASEPLTPEAEAFRDEVRQHLGAMPSRLAPLLAQEDAEAVAQELAAFFQEAAAAGGHLRVGLVVLDRKGVYSAGHYDSADDPLGEPAPQEEQGLNYGGYAGIQESLNKGRTSTLRVHVPRGEMLVICHPLDWEGGRVGALALIYAVEPLEERTGTPIARLQAMDFRP